MASVTHNKKKVSLDGDLPTLGKEAPDFTYVTKDWKEVSLFDVEADVKVIVAVPSVDTSVCAMETRKFNELMSSRKGVHTLVISKDLPPALGRFCGAEGIENVHAVSDFRYSDFGQEFGVEMIDGVLKNLLARSVFVLDSRNILRYMELVPDIAQEPNYDAVIKAVDKLL